MCWSPNLLYYSVTLWLQEANTSHWHQSPGVHTCTVWDLWSYGRYKIWAVFVGESINKYTYTSPYLYKLSLRAVFYLQFSCIRRMSAHVVWNKSPSLSMFLFIFKDILGSPRAFQHDYCVHVSCILIFSCHLICVLKCRNHILPPEVTRAEF